MRATDIVRYLVDASLMDSAHALHPDFEVVAAPRRNNNFLVLDPGGDDLMVKQAVSEDRAVTLAREAMAYRAFEDDGTPTAWRPRFHHYGETEGVLVLALVPATSTLRQRIVASGKVSRIVAEVLGRTLAQVHAQPPHPRRGQPSPASSTGPPWILFLDCPDASALESSSGAALEMMRIFQSSNDACRVLREHRLGWRSDLFVHGDLRWENCLVTSGRGRPTICLVDWELSGAGDPAWDLGCLLAGYLRLWLDSVPILSDTAIEPALASARFPLSGIQPATASLWAAYVGQRQDTQETASALALRATAFAGAALLQSVYEEAQTSALFSPHLAYRLQLACNVMARPPEAAVHLLGLSLDDAA